MKSLSHGWLLVTPWTAAYQAPPSMGFSRQEYWSGVPLPSPSEWLVHSKGIGFWIGVREGLCEFMLEIAINFLKIRWIPGSYSSHLKTGLQKEWSRHGVWQWNRIEDVRLGLRRKKPENMKTKCKSHGWIPWIRAFCSLLLHLSYILLWNLLLRIKKLDLIQER